MTKLETGRPSHYSLGKKLPKFGPLPLEPATGKQNTQMGKRPNAPKKAVLALKGIKEIDQNDQYMRKTSNFLTTATILKTFQAGHLGRHLANTCGEKTTDRSGRTKIIDRTDRNIVIDIST